MLKTCMPCRLAWRELRQGWRHFAIFLACLTIGVAVMAIIGTLDASIQSAMGREARSMLGGDVEISLTGLEATSEQRAKMESYGKVSHVTTMRAMLQYGETSTLVELKGVDGTYPMLGKLELRDSRSPAKAMTEQGLLVDKTLLAQLEADIGSKVILGNADYTITGVIQKEPDRVVQIFSFGPRVMLSLEALQRSGLIAPFSLVRHHYRVLMENPAQLPGFIEDLTKTYPDMPWRINTTTEGNTSVDRIIEQLAMFLSLSGLATFLIGGIGIGSAVRTYLEKEVHTIAILKTLGASQRIIFTTYALLLGGLAIIGSMIGLILAAITVALLSPIMATWLPIAQETWLDPKAALLAAWYGFLIVYLFSLPGLLSALEIRPALLFRSRIEPLLVHFTLRLWRLEILLACLLLLTLFITTGDTQFILIAIGVILLAFLLFGACTWLVRRAARRIKVKKPWLRLALGNLHRPGSVTGTVILAIGISLTVLIALTLTEANFQARITRIVTTQAPTLFMIDIQPDQKETFGRLLASEPNAKEIMMLPMVRGRVVALNGKAVVPEQVDEDVRWVVRGDRGFSYGPKPPENTQLVEGEWWPENYRGDPLVSVDERILKGMNLKLGDTMTFNILGQEIVAKIASARRIDYTSFQINFAMLLSPGVIDSFPQTYLATVHLRGDEKIENALVRRIAREYPNITTIRTAEAIARIKEIVGHVAIALRLTVLAGLLVGLLVLASALSAMMEARLYDTAVLKVLGARRADILKAATAEWMLLALLTSVIAAGIGTFSAWLIMKRFPEGEFYLLPEVALATIGCCLGIIWLTGYLGNQQIFRLRPARLLRNE